MKLTNQNTQFIKLLPVGISFAGFIQICIGFLAGYPFNLVVIVFVLLFFLYVFVVKKIGLYYKLEDLSYENPLFFTSKLSKPFTINDIDTIKSLKGGEITKVSLKDGRVYYFILDSEESRELLYKGEE